MPRLAAAAVGDDGEVTCHQVAGDPGPPVSILGLNVTMLANKTVKH
jgi:hypothetical protein